MSEQLDDLPQRRQAPKPVTTVAELETLDSDAIVRGYRDGFKDAANWGEVDRAYWHGYLNGLVDGGHAKISPEQAVLARAVVQARRGQ